MAERGRTVRILFLDGQERTFTNVHVDQKTAGWLFLTRVQKSAIISGVPAPIGAYRLQTLQKWEYVKTTATKRGTSTEGVG